MLLKRLNKNLFVCSDRKVVVFIAKQSGKVQQKSNLTNVLQFLLNVFSITVTFFKKIIGGNSTHFSAPNKK